MFTGVGIGIGVGIGFGIGIKVQVPEEGGIENVVVVGGCEESMRSVGRALWVVGAGCSGACRRQSQLQFVRNLAGNIFKTDRRARDAFETYTVQRKSWQFTNFDLPLYLAVCRRVAVRAQQQEPFALFVLTFIGVQYLKRSTNR